MRRVKVYQTTTIITPESKEVDSDSEEGSRVDIDAIATSLFQDDVRKVMGMVGSCSSNVDERNSKWTSLGFLQEVLAIGPCAYRSAEEFPDAPPFNTVEVSFDGEIDTIIGSGIVESVDAIARKKTPPRRRTSRLNRLRSRSLSF